ncbi:MAG: GTP cyclohydrolase I FolE, partial [Candidatus Dadabacteria bacterium]|nr:GTP cyclohydrolase I FolE [Candidatus Dadabacteria bacterium]
MSVKKAIKEILLYIGEDPKREGLRDTPARMEKMFQEVTSGYQVDPKEVINGAIFHIKYDEMVVVKDIEFYSLCEHHMLPFTGKAHVAYIPGEKVVGLSKIPRIVDMFARRLQVQERLTNEITDALESAIKPKGVIVLLEG